MRSRTNDEIQLTRRPATARYLQTLNPTSALTSPGPNMSWIHDGTVSTDVPPSNPGGADAWMEKPEPTSFSSAV